LFALSGFAQKASKRMTHFNLEKNVAIQGYDPVAISNKSLKGRKRNNCNV
jgi:hypothetical protein